MFSQAGAGVKTTLLFFTKGNPNRKATVDLRTPAELLDLIEAKGREVPEAIVALRNLTDNHS